MKLMKRKLNELETLNAYGNCGACDCSCVSCGCYCSGTSDPRNTGYSVTSYDGLGNSSGLSSSRSREKGVLR